MTKVKLFLLILFFSCHWLFAQNYIDYSRSINRAELQILNEDYGKSLQLYDSIFKSYNFCFAQDYFVALQVACYISDTNRVSKYIVDCLKSGVEIERILTDTITKSICTASFLDNNSLNIDSIQLGYYKSIDWDYRGKIINLASIDQFHRDKYEIESQKKFLSRLKWNKRWRLEIDNIITNDLIPMIIKNGYPGEKKIGIRKNWMPYESNYSNPITDITAQILFMHYYSFKSRKDYTKLLVQEIEKGNLRPNQFATIMDFASKFGLKNDKFYNQWHYSPNKSKKNIETINLRRHKVGLEPFEIHQEKLRRLFQTKMKLKKKPPLKYYFKLVCI